MLYLQAPPGSPIATALLCPDAPPFAPSHTSTAGSSRDRLCVEPRQVVHGTFKNTSGIEIETLGRGGRCVLPSGLMLAGTAWAERVGEVDSAREKNERLLSCEVTASRSYLVRGRGELAMAALRQQHGGRPTPRRIGGSSGPLGSKICEDGSPRGRWSCPARYIWRCQSPAWSGRYHRRECCAGAGRYDHGTGATVHGGINHRRYVGT